MHAICRGDGLFQRGKKCEFGKKLFSNSFFFVIVEKKQHPSEGEKNAANQHKPIR